VKPAIPSQPPPPPDDDAHGRAMTPFLATVWAIGHTLAAVWIMQLTGWLRDAARQDVVNSIACQAVAVLACLFLILRVHSPDGRIRDVLALRGTHPGFYPLAISIGLAVTLPASVLYSAILRKWPDATVDDALAQALTEGGTARRMTVAFAVVLLAPALEEALFRGGLFTPQRRRSDELTVVVVTAVLFALAHLAPQRFVPILIVGVGLGVLRAASGSLIPSLLMHATFNALPVYALLTQGPRSREDTEPLPWALAAGSAGLAVLLLFGAHLLGRRTEAAARARGADRL
jgi:hypothetical protein